MHAGGLALVEPLHDDAAIIPRYAGIVTLPQSRDSHGQCPRISLRSSVRSTPVDTI